MTPSLTKGCYGDASRERRIEDGPAGQRGQGDADQDAAGRNHGHQEMAPIGNEGRRTQPAAVPDQRPAPAAVHGARQRVNGKALPGRV